MIWGHSLISPGAFPLHSRNVLRLFFGLILAFCLYFPAFAQTPPKASPRTVLLSVTNTKGVVHDFTEEEFAQLPQHKLVTHTTWTDGPQEFKGVLARDVLHAAGIDVAAEKNRIAVGWALNDYQTLIPVSDFLDYDVLIARDMNGAPMSRRNMGPFWVIYPRDAHPELNDPLYDYRWIWQLRSLSLK